MSRKPVEPEKIERLKEMYLQGSKLADIAVEIQVHKATVARYIGQLGLLRDLWSDEEISILKANVHLSYRKISALLNGAKTWYQVEHMIRKMDLRKGRSDCLTRKYLNIRELEQFKKDYPNYTTKELAIKYGISASQIKSKAREFGLTKAYETNKPYTDEDIAFIEEWYGRIPASQIAAKLGRTKDQINSFIYRHGIKKNERQVREEDL
jgi:uncharacterized protein YjcR